MTLPARHIKNSGWPPAKTGLNFHLAGSAGVKMAGKHPLKITYFRKMIVLFSIQKQLPTAVKLKLRLLIFYPKMS